MPEILSRYQGWPVVVPTALGCGLPDALSLIGPAPALSDPTTYPPAALEEVAGGQNARLLRRSYFFQCGGTVFSE
jgi:hypothetical protein